jgi:molybdopterin-guanine dinucleotide biosynthesis protein A
VDFPFVSSLVPALLAALRAMCARAIVPAPGGQLQPLAAAYSAEAVETLVAAYDAGERSITRAVERILPTIWDDARIEAAGGAIVLFNLNTLDDLREAERMLDSEATRS